MSDPELTAQRLAGLASSASFIRQVISDNDRAQWKLDAVRRNCDHIGIACWYDDVQASGTDLSDFWAAQSEGIAWLGTN